MREQQLCISLLMIATIDCEKITSNNKYSMILWLLFFAFFFYANSGLRYMCVPNNTILNLDCDKIRAGFV